MCYNGTLGDDPVAARRDRLKMQRVDHSLEYGIDWHVLDLRTYIHTYSMSFPCLPYQQSQVVYRVHAICCQPHVCSRWKEHSRLDSKLFNVGGVVQVLATMDIFLDINPWFEKR